MHRLKGNGWLESEARDGARGYALTDAALETLAAGDEVIWHARTPAVLDDGWCIVHFGVPESMRAKRQQLRAHLGHLGFGNVGTALWIAPARMRDAAQRAVAELGLEAHTAVFVGDYHGTQDLTGLLYDSWDLAGIDQSYRDFVSGHATLVAAVEQRAPGARGGVPDLPRPARPVAPAAVPRPRPAGRGARAGLERAARGGRLRAARGRARGARPRPRACALDVGLRTAGLACDAWTTSAAARPRTPPCCRSSPRSAPPACSGPLAAGPGR